MQDATSTDRGLGSKHRAAAGPHSWLRWALPALLFVAALLPYLPARSFGFVEYDDEDNLSSRGNPHFNEVRHALDAPTLQWMFTQSHLGHYQPLTWLSYAVDAALAGRFDPRDFHRTNLLLHGLNAVLVYALARRLLRAALRGRVEELPLTVAACSASLVYAVHPLRVESVVWITERRDVLSAAFLLLSVLAYLSFVTRDGRRGLWIALSLACYALSLLSKAWGITLPLVLLVIDLFPLRRRSDAPSVSWRRLIGEKLLYLPFALASAILAVQAQSTARLSFEVFGLFKRIALACYGLWFYPIKLVWPSNLTPLVLLDTYFDPTRPLYVACMALVALALLALVLLRRRLPGLVAAAVAYAILVSPVLGFSQSGPQKVADRYTYIAAIPLCVLAGGLLLSWMVAGEPRKVARRSALAAGIALIACGVLGTLARSQTWVWRDSESLFRRIVEVEPHNFFGLHGLSIALARRQETREEALFCARAAVDAAPPLDNLEERLNLVNLLVELGRGEEADAQLIAGLEVAPDWLVGLYRAVNRRLEAGAMDEALALVERSLARAPRFVDGYAELARVQVARGHPELAQQAWQRGLQIDPGWVHGNFAMGVQAFEARNPVRAAELFERALAAGAGNASVLIALGRAYQAQGRLTDARASYERALALEPANPRVRELLDGLDPTGR
jgi:protein O-mannosyl-transferase